MKFLVCAIVALLAVESITLTHGLEVRAAEPEALKFAARAVFARQEPEATPTDPTEPITTTSVLSKAPPTPAVPTDAVPTDVVDTILSKNPAVASASASAYVPSGTGSLIPSWSAFAKTAGVPTNQPSSAPSQTSVAGKSTDAPTSGAHKTEIGLISGSLIAGIVSLFF